MELEKMDNLICYCFGYTEDDIKEDFLKNGHSLIQKKIQSEKKFGSCECATKNPKGKWCLPDVSRVLSQVKTKFSQPLS